MFKNLRIRPLEPIMINLVML